MGADAQILLATGAPIPVNTSLLAAVASSGQYSDLSGTITNLSELVNDLVSTSGPFTVLGDLKLVTGTITSAPSVNLNGSLQATGNAVTCVSLTSTGPFTCQAGASFNTTVSVSGALTCGSTIKAQGVQVPRTTFGTVSQAVNIAAGSSTSLPVSYGVVYANLPAVTATVAGAGAAVVANVDSLTKNGFTATVHNLSPTAYAGSLTVGWHAMATN